MGCRKRTVAAELLRVAVIGTLGGDADVIVVGPDPARRLPGRGASLHPDLGCYTLAEKRRAFGRALRVAGVPDTGAVREYVMALGTTGCAGTSPHSEEK
ncbi:MAG: hypothetical protein JWO79_4628 [Actinomycetia bacterium]|nr:hypothetical protein [Actinomycetes bacterium]